MKRLFLTGLAAVVAAHIFPAAAQEAFRAPKIRPEAVVSLPAPAEKAVASRVDGFGRMRVGDVRELPKSADIGAWVPAAGGFVSRLRTTSENAEGIRVKLALGAVPGPIEVRVQGTDPTQLESMVIDPTLGPESWTPWTAGDTQVIELFSRVLPSPGAVKVASLVHFTDTPFAKAAASCTVSTACPSDDPELEQMLAERKRSVLRIQFVSGGGAFNCTATLVDTPLRPASYLLTANHCVDTAAAASTITSFWFYESTSCQDHATAPGRVQRSGGFSMVFTNFNVDATLLLYNQAPPPGATYSPINQAQVGGLAPIVSISHPRGDTARWATGTTAGGNETVVRDNDRPYDMYLVNFNHGLVEPGSSGSGLFTRANGRLELRGILSQAAIDLGCDQPDLYALYSRMDVFYPQIARYIGASSAVADDAPNRPQDVTTSISGVPLDTLAEPLVLPSQRIDYVGDVDLYRFTIAATSQVTAFTRGPQDTVGTILSSNGTALVSIDDAERSNTNAGITTELPPGTYYFHVANWIPGTPGPFTPTGPYELHLRADRVVENYTALWWNAAESGWGLNVNHQGNILFATLFTYNPNGTPVWLVMSRGDRQGDGSYTGTLYRATGPAFNANPWTAITATPVGTMTLAFAGEEAGTLTYTFNNVTVTKAITRQNFKAPPSCTWSAFDRSWATNFQDLWWNSNESGWGVNITHQENTLFATLFTYAPNGQPIWYVMSDGAKTGAATYSGALYSTTGPAFNATPWTAITPNPVGNMSFTFTDGDTGTMTYNIGATTVTKNIKRQVFSVPKTQCES